jgi:hypothetical protein
MKVLDEAALDLVTGGGLRAIDLTGWLQSPPQPVGGWIGKRPVFSVGGGEQSPGPIVKPEPRWGDRLPIWPHEI